MRNIGKFLAIAIVLCSYLPAHAEREILRKEVRGRLLSLTPLEQPEYIGVELWTDRGALNKEMHFRLGAGYRVLGKEYIEQIRMGDIVDIGYDEVTEADLQGKATVQYIARTVSLVHGYRKISFEEKLRTMVGRKAAGSAEGE